MIAAVHFERGIADTDILGVIICKFGYWQELCLVILFLVDEDLKLYLYCDILLFGLIAYLKIKCGW